MRFLRILFLGSTFFACTGFERSMRIGSMLTIRCSYQSASE